MPAAPSAKLQALLKDFQQIASMSGYLNHSFDPPQLRLFFTLYGRVMVASPEQGRALTPQLQAWCETLSTRLREGSSATIMQPQIQVSAPQTMPDGRDYLVAAVTFNTKVTETSYLRIRNAVLVAYQDAVKMREVGFSVEAMPEPMATGHGLPASPAGDTGEVPE
ncbi:MAG TPA: hypothetical protein VGJ89_08460 [Geothrix sp.]|jgi:hypothetical protein